MVAVAVAVLPTPTIGFPTSILPKLACTVTGGADSLTVGATVYPEPKLEVLNPVTVPVAETIAVASAVVKSI